MDLIGKTISHYRILEKLGEGGMGVVYKAEDTRLKRTVALKFLPPDMTGDTQARQRIIQEARAASMLEHANICNVHEIGETDLGQSFIVMACYEGETLKKRIESGPLAVPEALDIAIQVACGLEKAHQQGVIHRDIKPGNVFIDKEGVVKIIDFGLAKLAEQQRLTRTGETVGTIAYISPEQIKMESVDAGTDIWSLGVVLYEMVTGRLPFSGEHDHEMIYSILNRKPDKMRLKRSSFSADLEIIVLRALSKKRGKRYRTMLLFLKDLEQLRERIRESRAPFRIPAKWKYFVTHRISWPLAAGLTGFSVLLYLVVAVKPFTSELAPWLREDAALIQLTSDPGQESGKISPDGRHLVYNNDMGRPKLKILQTGEIRDIQLPDSLGAELFCWSNDSRRFLMQAGKEDNEYLYMADTSGQSRIFFPIGNVIACPAWSPDDRLIALCSDTIQGETRSSTLTVIDTNGIAMSEFSFEEPFIYPAWAPDSRHIALMTLPDYRDFRGAIRILDMDSGIFSDPLLHGRPVVKPWWRAGMTWSPDGKYLVYVGMLGNTRELFALPINQETWMAISPPVQVTDLADQGKPAFPSFTKSGDRLSFSIVRENWDILFIPVGLESASFSGEIIPIARSTKYDSEACWLAGGSSVVFSSDRSGRWDLYRFDLETGQTVPLTHTEEKEQNPRIQPGGRFVSFWADSAVKEIPMTGGESRRITPETIKCRNRFAWSADGRNLFLVVRDSSDRRTWNLIRWNIGSGRHRILLREVRYVRDIRLSPDGRLLAMIYTDSPDGPMNIGVVNPRNGMARILYETPAIAPCGYSAWSTDSRYIICDVREKGEIVYKMIPVDGSPPLNMDLDSGLLRGDIFLGELDPAGRRILLHQVCGEADIWTRGENRDSQL
jgi:serine/threonine protein kinase